ncbi:GNAT family N-acetyltransferase [Psychrobium sp. 1_MG-2023]|uniref:GNAT family N-acetyltransferase n=1 Tax=Psychrobium sp. 1_MG-2023 TaxID=3062624 RepID=UPI000C34DF72|nr:GNAT family N-acetyltransferase [Psychrobium sp. 1_MG-2023]MDP2560226.1 N-acetyltransferase family protein [Psychrobium sp. 1_MG-2023]PKF57036.1 GNAT family N-acetyltransferase [Alteromonadales bacterium alter-6D02]
MLKIRQATLDDLTEIDSIYNHYIRHSAATFDLKPWPSEKRQAWFKHIKSSPRNEVLVAVHHEQVVAFAFNSPYNLKAAYANSTEITIYKSPACQLKGVGKILFRYLFEALEKHQFHRAYSLITLPNPESVKLHQNFDFKHIGTLTESGLKFAQYHDVAILEKALN